VWSKRLTIVIFIFFLAGCATTAPDVPDPFRRICGDTSKNVVIRFVKGLTEYSWEIIISVIPKGVHPFVVFGGGDKNVGRKKIGNFIKYPGELRIADDVDTDFYLEKIEDKGLIFKGFLGEKIITIKRRDTVLEGEDMRPLEPVFYRRRFWAEFDPWTNCIKSIREYDKKWILIN